MKNNLLSLTAIAVLTLGIGGCTAKQEATEIKEKSVCPVLNIENITQEQFYEAKDLMEGLRFTVPNALTVYTDILKHYNKVDNADKYISKDGFTDVINKTAIFFTLIAMKSLSASLDTDGSAGTDELITMYKEAYKEVLNSIDAKNPNWCEAESYQHLIDKYALFAEKEKSTHKEKE